MRSITIFVASFCLLSISGCQPDHSTPTTVGIATKQALSIGLEAVEAQDWNTADTQLTTALTGKGLQADERGRALLARAKARVELGHLDEAESDLIELQQAAAGEMNLVYLLKCEWAIKKGYIEEANAAFDEARKINPELPAPSGLNRASF